MRIVRQPAHRNFLSTWPSRTLFRAIFASQNSLREPERLLQDEQPCQKQPSTNIAKRFDLKAKSGVPGSVDSLSVQPIIAFRINNARNRHSVDRLPLLRTLDIISERLNFVTLSIENSSSSLKTSSTVSQTDLLQPAY
jgi:hypothetical protein